MLAIFRHPLAPLAQMRIGLGRAIGRDDVKWIACFHLLRDVKEEIQKPWIDVNLFICTAVAQDVINFMDRFGDVIALRPIDGFDPLACVAIV